jgi:hypothetical protein
MNRAAGTAVLDRCAWRRAGERGTPLIYIGHGQGDHDDAQTLVDGMPAEPHDPPDACFKPSQPRHDMDYTMQTNPVPDPVADPNRDPEADPLTPPSPGHRPDEPQQPDGPPSHDPV